MFLQHTGLYIACSQCTALNHSLKHN